MNKFFTEGGNSILKFNPLFYFPFKQKCIHVAGGAPVNKLEDASRINQQGQVSCDSAVYVIIMSSLCYHHVLSLQIFFVLGFLLFQIIFWSVALAEFVPE